MIDFTLPLHLKGPSTLCTHPYFLRVDEIVNVIKGIGGNIKEREVVLKVLRTIPIMYDSKVSTLE